MPVPFIDLRRFEPDFLDRWMQKARHVTENTMFVGGPVVTDFEKRLAAVTGARAAVGCANGTDALQLALRVAGVGPGDRVLLPDATFWATFEAVVNVGAIPVTVDIDMTDLQMDFDLFRQAVAEYRPKAVLLVHLYGWCSARLDDFRQFCTERRLPLIEDGAQCFGVVWRGRPIYADAWMATTSFYPAKVLGSCGDAGAVFCSTSELADAIRLHGNHGRVTHYLHGVIGWNSRMAGMDAAYLDLCLDYIDARLSSRIEAARWYREQFAGVAGLPVVGPPEGCDDNGYLVALIANPDKRPAIEAHLKQRGIGFGNVYPSAMSEQPGARGWHGGHVGGDNARVLGRSILNPPLFAYITREEQQEVVAAFREAAGK
jgi:dTDP-4-amino-4,6-dideoxygalactose transaminase